MKHKFSILAALVLSVAMLLTGCASGEGGKVSGSDQAADTAWNPEVTQRSVLKEEGSPCGVVYFLYDDIYDAYNHDITTDRDYFKNIIEKSVYKEEFPFLTSVPDDHWAGTAGGCDFYLIIPADEHSKVEVVTLELAGDDDVVSFNTVDTIYQQDDGAPFLLKCNVSDIFPEIRMIITDSNGDVFEWSPMISMRDGSVFLTGEDGRKAHDFTHYPEGIPETDE
ncbi:MAG: hypothetical protein II828_09295 [Clostridia bacterium]|nr:hypothetical protein [Clostridia bacterium]MBQ4397704.1 hypothetical protein [Clostridia bacterium]